jgi:hypothetical protein
LIAYCGKILRSIVMGKLNNLLIDLEDQGKIIWSSEKRCYVLTSDTNKPFDLTMYLSEKANNDKEKTENR